MKPQATPSLHLLTKEIRSIVKPLFDKNMMAFIDIASTWPSLVGEELAQGTRPKQLKFTGSNRMKGVLHIAVQSGAFALVLEHKKELILSRINAFFGFPAVSQIRIMQGAFQPVLPPVKPDMKSISPEQRRQLEETLAKITDEHLRNTLFQIGLERLKKET